MYIERRNRNGIICITRNNFDGLTIEDKGNIVCILNGRIVSVGQYQRLTKESTGIVCDMLFDTIVRNIDTDYMLIMPKNDEDMMNKVSNWTVDKSSGKAE